MRFLTESTQVLRIKSNSDINVDRGTRLVNLFTILIKLSICLSEICCPCESRVIVAFPIPASLENDR